MKTLVAAFITALLVFILATGWMEVVQPRLDLLAAATAAHPGESANRLASKQKSLRTAGVDNLDDDEVAIEAPVKATTKSSRPAKPSRDETMLTEKTKARVAAQLAEVKQKEAKLVAREETLRMLYEDIRSELAAVEEIRRRSAYELAQAERQVQETLVAKTNVASLANVAATSTVPKPKSAKPADAYIAGLVHDLASRGSVDTAAGLLRGMKERDIAKVLASLSTRDPRLAFQLSEQFQAAKQEATIRR